MQRTSADYIAGAPGKRPTKLSAGGASSASNITVNAARAKIELDYPNAKLTDYMSLLKIGGEWKIVNKIFTSVPKAR